MWRFGDENGMRNYLQFHDLLYSPPLPMPAEPPAAENAPRRAGSLR